MNLKRIPKSLWSFEFRKRLDLRNKIDPFVLCLLLRLNRILAFMALQSIHRLSCSTESIRNRLLVDFFSEDSQFFIDLPEDARIVVFFVESCYVSSMECDLMDRFFLCYFYSMVVLFVTSIRKLSTDFLSCCHMKMGEKKSTIVLPFFITTLMILFNDPY